MKQDNGWFERGELPPVGVFCKWIGSKDCGDYRDDLRSGDLVEIIAHYQPRKHGQSVAVFAYEAKKLIGRQTDQSIAKCFRPIRTEREVLISVIIDEMNRYDTDAKLADAILAAGFKLGVK